MSKTLNPQPGAGRMTFFRGGRRGFVLSEEIKLIMTLGSNGLADFRRKNWLPPKRKINHDSARLKTKIPGLPWHQRLKHAWGKELGYITHTRQTRRTHFLDFFPHSLTLLRYDVGRKLNNDDNTDPNKHSRRRCTGQSSITYLYACTHACI